MVGQSALKAAMAKKMVLVRAARGVGSERDRSTPPTLGDGTHNLGNEVNPLTVGGELNLPPCPEAHPEGTGTSAGPSVVPIHEAEDDDVDVATGVPLVEVVNPGDGDMGGAVEGAPILLDSSPELEKAVGKRKVEESGGSRPKRRKFGLQGEGAGYGVLLDTEGANCMASFQAVAKMRLGGEDLAAYTEMKDYDDAFLKYVTAREKGEIYLLKVLEMAHRAKNKAEGAELVRMEMAKKAEESEKRASALEKELQQRTVELEGARAENGDLRKRATQNEQELSGVRAQLAEVVSQKCLAVRKMKTWADQLKASGPFLRAEAVRTALSGPAYEAYQAGLIADQFGDGFGLAIDHIRHAGGLKEGFEPLDVVDMGKNAQLEEPPIVAEGGEESSRRTDEDEFYPVFQELQGGSSRPPLEVSFGTSTWEQFQQLAATFRDEFDVFDAEADTLCSPSRPPPSDVPPAKEADPDQRELE